MKNYNLQNSQHFQQKVQQNTVYNEFKAKYRGIEAPEQKVKLPEVSSTKKKQQNDW